MKKCGKCKANKSYNDYHKSKNSKDGLYHWCKSCKREYDLLYRKTDKIKRYYKSNEYRDRKKEYQKWWITSDYRRLIWRGAKNRAKKNNIPFNIDIEDIIIPEYCPILNIKLERKPYGKGGSFQPNSPSIDRIIPELGYVKGNIIIMSMKANTMKNNASKEELALFCKNILSIYN